MLATYDDYLALLEADATRDGLSALSAAREEFHTLTGLFEDGEPWFEVRMTMFLDWFLLDRLGPDGLTPIERYLSAHGPGMAEAERRQLGYLTTTHRSVFRLLSRRDEDGTLVFEDLSLGGHFRVRSSTPSVGLKKGDILDTRLVWFGDGPLFGRSTVLHPKDATEAILAIIARAQQAHMPPRELVDHLDKMRLKLDRYSNVRVAHVYRYPDEAVF